MAQKQASQSQEAELIVLAAEPFIPLHGTKTSEAINLKGKMSAFWNIESIPGISIKFYPRLSVVAISAPGMRTKLVPLANTPYMEPLD